MHAEYLRPKPISGFTLLELLTTIVIIAILAAIAYPSYINQIMQSQRTSAKTALLDLSSREAQYYSTNNAYNYTLSQLGYSGSGDSTGSIAIPGTTSHYYDLTVSAEANGGGFIGQAAPVGTQANDSCGTYYINELGVKSVSGSGTNCW